jgi:hypothetical protein
VPVALVYGAAVKYPACETKSTLLLNWQIATDSYTRALSQLARCIGSTSADEYQRIRLAVENAREVSREARHVFEEHIDLHHCRPGEREPD